MAKEPKLVAVRFKNPTAESIQISGRTILKSDLTPELYIKLMQLSPAYANEFELDFENVKVEPIKEETNG